MDAVEHIWYEVQTEPSDEQTGEILRAMFQLKRVLEAPTDEALRFLSPDMPPLLAKLREALEG